jgi:thermitase
VVAAAGNEGLNRRHYMAAFPRVYAVASAADVGGGPAVCYYSNRGNWVDFSTQGSDVETVRGLNRRVAASGTSFATPKIVARILETAEVRGIPNLGDAATALAAGGRAIPGGGSFIDVPTP